jgi:hypothetical protein
MKFFVAAVPGRARPYLTNPPRDGGSNHPARTGSLYVYKDGSENKSVPRARKRNCQEIGRPSAEGPPETLQPAPPNANPADKRRTGRASAPIFSLFRCVSWSVGPFFPDVPDTGCQKRQENRQSIEPWVGVWVPPTCASRPEHTRPLRLLPIHVNRFGLRVRPSGGDHLSRCQ